MDELCLVRVCSEYAHKIHLPKSERNSMEGFSKDDWVKSDASNPRIIKISDFSKSGSRFFFFFFFLNYTKTLSALCKCIHQNKNFKCSTIMPWKQNSPSEFPTFLDSGKIQVSSQGYYDGFRTVVFQRPRDASLFFFFFEHTHVTVQCLGPLSFLINPYNEH